MFINTSDFGLRFCIAFSTLNTPKTIAILDILSPCANSSGSNRTLNLGIMRGMFYLCAAASGQKLQLRFNLAFSMAGGANLHSESNV
jgi:hypothetical protein